MAASEPREILYPTAPPPKMKSIAAVSAGPTPAETFSVSEKSRKNSPIVSGGESTTSMTRPTVREEPQQDHAGERPLRPDLVRQNRKPTDHGEDGREQEQVPHLRAGHPEHNPPVEGHVGGGGVRRVAYPAGAPPPRRGASRCRRRAPTGSQGQPPRRLPAPQRPRPPRSAPPLRRCLRSATVRARAPENAPPLPTLCITHIDRKKVRMLWWRRPCWRGRRVPRSLPPTWKPWIYHPAVCYRPSTTVAVYSSQLIGQHFEPSTEFAR